MIRRYVRISHTRDLCHICTPVCRKIDPQSVTVGRVSRVFSRWQNGKRHSGALSQVLGGSRNRAKLFDILSRGGKP